MRHGAAQDYRKQHPVAHQIVDVLPAPLRRRKSSKCPIGLPIKEFTLGIPVTLATDQRGLRRIPVNFHCDISSMA